jgi:NTE family protein
MQLVSNLEIDEKSLHNTVYFFIEWSMALFGLMPKKKKYTLVISWWGARWFYAMGILKWLEELWMKEHIAAIYGVSAGAVIWSYRAAGYSAQQIFDIFLAAHPFGLTSLNIFSKESLLKADYFKKQFAKDLPKSITKLNIKTHIWATNVNTGTFLVFDSWDLIPILMGSMSVPGLFPVVKYQTHILMDGWATNNFPVALAKKEYPDCEIIGIALDKFKKNQKIYNVLDTVTIAFEIVLRHQTLENIWLVDHLFYKDLDINVFDTNKKNMQKAYSKGYQDCLKHFK